MVRNRNGYWMSPKFMFSPDNGGAAGASSAGATGTDLAGGNDPAGNDPAGNEPNGADPAGNDPDGDDQPDAKDAEIARLKAEMAKQKQALDAATSEAGKYRKELNSRKTKEEIEATEKAEAAEKQAKELEDLRKQVAKGNTVKMVMGKLGLDEESAGNLADHLYGASDIDNAILEFQKALKKKEADLRKEYGRVTAPGAGADSNSPEAQAIKQAQEIGKSRNAVNKQAQDALKAYIR